MTGQARSGDSSAATRQLAFTFMSMGRTARQRILSDLGVWEPWEGQDYALAEQEALREVVARGLIADFRAAVNSF